MFTSFSEDAESDNSDFLLIVGFVCNSAILTRLPHVVRQTFWWIRRYS